jgi:glycosyltransferase involved in cell wall biosynthesis
MKKRILVRGPVLSRSGYGEQSRFALRCLRAHEDYFDIYIIPVGWGKTGWMWEENEERRWMDGLIRKTLLHNQQGGQYDISLQITIPNEWEKMAPINIGYTAGIETTRVAPQWIEKSDLMDHIIVVSNFAKETFEKTSYDLKDENSGQIVKQIRCQTPITPVNYCVKKFDVDAFDLDLEYDFNFFAAAQWGVRKNLDNTIKWFVEEFIDQEVGLVLKANWHNDSIYDRRHAQERLEQLLQQYPDRKCKVYLLHGSLTDTEIHAIYKHPKIKALMTATHGEGFGLPLFEAAYSGVPIVAPNWSGQCDFLNMPVKDKKSGKKKNKAMFANVAYDLQPIQKEAVWDGVLQADSMWCFPQQGSFKMRLREMRKDYGRFKKQATQLQKWLHKNFAPELQYDKFVTPIKNCLSEESDKWMSEIENIVNEYE